MQEKTIADHRWSGIFCGNAARNWWSFTSSTSIRSDLSHTRSFPWASTIFCAKYYRMEICFLFRWVFFFASPFSPKYSRNNFFFHLWISIQEMINPNKIISVLGCVQGIGSSTKNKYRRVEVVFCFIFCCCCCSSSKNYFIEMSEIEGTTNKDKEEEAGKKNFIKRNMIWNAAPSNAISV